MSFKNKVHPSHTQKTCWSQMFLLMTMISRLKLPGKQLYWHCTRDPYFVRLWWWSFIWEPQNKQSQCHLTKCLNFLGLWLCTVLWNYLQKNHSITAPSAHILLGSDSMKYQHNNRTCRPAQELPQPGKYYPCFQMNGKTAHDVQCYKSRKLTEGVPLVFNIESFEQEFSSLKVCCSQNDWKHMLAI